MNVVWKSALSEAGVSLVWGMAGAAIMLAGYHVAIRPVQFVIATVDLVGLIQDQRDHALMVAAKPGASSHALRHTAERLQTFGAVVEAEAKRLATERGVILVQRQAVVAGQLPDLTEEIRHALNSQSGGQ